MNPVYPPGFLRFLLPNEKATDVVALIASEVRNQNLPMNLDVNLFYGSAVRVLDGATPFDPAAPIVEVKSLESVKFCHGFGKFLLGVHLTGIPHFRFGLSPVTISGQELGQKLRLAVEDLIKREIAHMYFGLIETPTSGLNENRDVKDLRTVGDVRYVFAYDAIRHDKDLERALLRDRYERKLNDKVLTIFEEARRTPRSNWELVYRS